MPSLRALSLLLVLLVAVPTVALAALGLGAADGLEFELEQRLGEELGDAAQALQALALEKGDERDRDNAAWAADLAAALARRLPHDEPCGLLPLLQQLSAAHPGEHLAPSILEARVLASDGSVLRPAPFHPDLIPRDPQARLLFDLRQESERALAQGGGLEAAVSVWSAAEESLRALGLGAVVEVESAWIRSRGGADAGQEAAQLLARNHDLVRSPAARTWVLLLLRACAADATGLVRGVLKTLALDGSLDCVPLTAQERAACLGRRGLRDELTMEGPPDDPLRAALPAGLQLEIRGDVFRERFVRFGRVLDAWGRSPHRPTAIVEVSGSGLGGRPPVGARVFDLRLGGSHAIPVQLRHEGADALRAGVASRRRWTAVGVAALVVVVTLGLTLAQRALRREREAVKLRDDFLANVSHELRTPLTSVCLHADLLAEERVPDAKRRAYAEVVRAEGARLATLVEDLLDVGALERGARRLEPEPVDVALAVERAAAPLRVLTQSQGRTLTVEAGAPGAALADPHALARILSNLLRNALDHGSGGIGVVAATGATGAFIEVSDAGPGIPASERARLFERFRRGSTAKGTRGTGLGLALSRALARAMGGDLVLRDDATRTVFRLTLPGVSMDGVEGGEEPHPA